MKRVKVSLTANSPGHNVAPGSSTPRQGSTAMTERGLRVVDAHDNGMREIYEHYVRYVAELGADRDRRYEPRAFEDFSGWWQNLDRNERRSLETNFRKGLPQVLADGERNVDALLRGRK